MQSIMHFAGAPSGFHPRRCSLYSGIVIIILPVDLEKAKAVLKETGYDLPALPYGDAGG
jgi:hypothetical protein